MIKVYIVTGYDAHSEDILGVFGSMEKAQQYMDSIRDRGFDYAGIGISVQEVK